MKPIVQAFVLIGLLMFLPSVSFGADPKTSTQQSPDRAITLQKPAGGSIDVAGCHLKSPDPQSGTGSVFAGGTGGARRGALQAGLYKNPNILFDVQDVLGSGGFKKVQQSQSTIILSQVIELGGKRTKRERAALSHKDLAFWDYETARMNILTQVTKGL